MDCSKCKMGMERREDYSDYCELCGYHEYYWCERCKEFKSI